MPLVRYALVATLIFLPGCDKKSTNPGDDLAKVEHHTWAGPYVGISSGQGNLVLDVEQTGTDVRGEVVYGSDPTQHFFLVGTLNGSDLRMNLDPAQGPYTFTFLLTASVLHSGALIGDMQLSLGSWVASFQAAVVPRRLAVLQAHYDVPYEVKSLAFDGSYLWLGTIDNDYVRVTTAGGIVDTIAVFWYGDLHWTSSTLAWDGHEMWGTLPGNSASGEYDTMYGFNTTGRTGDSLVIHHRSLGLAYTGSSFWSLANSTLRHLDGTGAIADSVLIGVPDAVHLDYGNLQFWTLGWYMHRLYALNTDGSIAWIADLPGGGVGGGDPTGIAFQGPEVWVAHTH